MAFKQYFHEDTRTWGEQWIDESVEDYTIAACGKCGDVTPVCCDTAEGPYCAVCCPRRGEHKPLTGDFQRMDCDGV